MRDELTDRLPYPDPAKAEDSIRTAARSPVSRARALRAATSLAWL